jgi:HlyD family secretion protein
MDIPRKQAGRKRKIRRALYILIAIIAVTGVTIGVSRLQPAVQSVDGGTILKGVVKRGNMSLQVRGLGTLVPEEVRYVPAMSQGRVEKKLVQPGLPVTANTVLVELSNPEVQQAALDAESQFRAAQADLSSLKIRLEKQLLDQKATAASIAADYKAAKLEAEVTNDLGNKGLKSPLEVKLANIKAEDLENRNNIELQRARIADDDVKAQVSSQEEKVAQLRAAGDLKRKLAEDLKVKAGIDGVLQLVQVEVGQQVTPGQNLARVANPRKLKAELKVSETLAKDIEIGQKVSVDTRSSGIIQGKVSRIDQSVQNGTRTVDAELVGELPRGAVADMSVDGTILLAELENILWVGRPVHGQENATIGLFKVVEGGKEAVRTQVKLGRTSVTTVEILGGLNEGDTVILSDTSQFDAAERIRLN